jgi:hypothetical protein
MSAREAVGHCCYFACLFMAELWPERRRTRRRVEAPTACKVRSTGGVGKAERGQWWLEQKRTGRGMQWGRATGTSIEIDGVGSDSMVSLRKLSLEMSEEAAIRHQLSADSGGGKVNARKVTTRRWRLKRWRAKPENSATCKKIM